MNHAEVRDNQCVVIVTSIDRRQRACPRVSNQVLRQLFGFANSEQLSSIRRVAADHGGRTIAAASDIMGYDQGV